MLNVQVGCRFKSELPPPRAAFAAEAAGHASEDAVPFDGRARIRELAVSVVVGRTAGHVLPPDVRRRFGLDFLEDEIVFASFLGVPDDVEGLVAAGAVA